MFKSLNYLRRAILSTLIYHFDFEGAEVADKKINLLEELLEGKKHLFTKQQTEIIREALKEIKEARGEGCYDCWILSDLFIQEAKGSFYEEELLEILATTPLDSLESVEYYLRKLEQKVALQKITLI